MHNKNEILDWLYSLQRFGIKPGLERTLALAEYCGNPHRRFRSIHIAGTNGKGAVASLMASSLMESGLRTALYTSPHLVQFNERMRINDDLITDDEMFRLAEMLRPRAIEIGATFFEITTVMAFKWFAERGAEVAVVETGMGGRFDSTNILQPEVSVITPVDLDHREYLGETIEEIAFEKAGIIKPGAPVVIAPGNLRVRDIFIDKAAETGSEIIFAENIFNYNIPKFRRDMSIVLDINSESINIDNLTVGMAGRHQPENIITAIAALNALPNGIAPKEQDIRRGMENTPRNTGYRGRLELFHSDPPIVIDSGHNPAAIESLIESLGLHRPGERWHLIFGAMKDKDIGRVLEILAPICDSISAVRPNIGRAAAPEVIAIFAKNAGFSEIYVSNDLSGAIASGAAWGRPMLIAGSFYMAGEAIGALEKILR
ncbi:MAG: bifunctional folylpolyglutamate synthase/dihydrofolate synthase [Candidatus Kapaibacterium sp.]